MDAHIVGRQAPEGGMPDAEGNSIAVVQFVELVRGERVVQAPVSWGVVEVYPIRDAYCLFCCGVHPHDVARAARRVVWYRCRFCGKEVLVDARF